MKIINFNHNCTLWSCQEKRNQHIVCLTVFGGQDSNQHIVCAQQKWVDLIYQDRSSFGKMAAVVLSLLISLKQ